jgi:hypothetical protein
MRCQDVTRELAAPNGDIDAGALADHLAACPNCAAWARRGEQFQRLWDATRLEEPPVSFDAAWAKVSRTLDAPADRPVPGRQWRRWAITFAQAAVLLVAAVLLFSRGGGNPPDGPNKITAVLHDPSSPTERRPGANTFDLKTAWVDIEPGPPVLIHLDDLKAKAEPQPQMELAYNVADDFDMLNVLESKAQ